MKGLIRPWALYVLLLIFGGTVNLDVFNDQVIGIQTLVFGVRFGILKQIQQEFTRLLGPTTLRSSMNFSLSMTANTSHESAERNDFLLFDDVLQVSRGTVQRHPLDSLSRLTSVLEVNTKV